MTTTNEFVSNQQTALSLGVLETLQNELKRWKSLFAVELELESYLAQAENNVKLQTSIANDRQAQLEQVE